MTCGFTGISTGPLSVSTVRVPVSAALEAAALDAVLEAAEEEAVLLEEQPLRVSALTVAVAASVP